MRSTRYQFGLMLLLGISIFTGALSGSALAIYGGGGRVCAGIVGPAGPVRCPAACGNPLCGPGIAACGITVANPFRGNCSPGAPGSTCVKKLCPVGYSCPGGIIICACAQVGDC